MKILEHLVLEGWLQQQLRLQGYLSFSSIFSHPTLSMLLVSSLPSKNFFPFSPMFLGSWSSSVQFLVCLLLPRQFYTLLSPKKNIIIWATRHTPLDTSMHEGYLWSLLWVLTTFPSSSPKAVVDIMVQGCMWVRETCQGPNTRNCCSFLSLGRSQLLLTFPSFEDLCASYHTPLPTYDSNFCCHLTLPTHPGPSCPAWLSPEGLLPSCIPVLHLTLLSHMLAHKPSSQLPPSQQGLAEKRDAESLRSPSHLRCYLLLEVESKAQGARPRGFPPDGKRWIL